MGCGGSTLENDSPGLVLHKRDKIKIHLHVGKEVKILPSKPQVIVVFGKYNYVLILYITNDIFSEFLFCMK